MLSQTQTAQRIVDRAPEPRREARRLCTTTGCEFATSDRKLFCVEHLGRIPYVKALQAELSRRAAEVVAAQRAQPFVADAGGGTTTDIVAQLEIHGAQTVERLGLEMQLPKRAVQGFVRSLERAGLVQVLTLGSRRGRLRVVVTATPATSRRAS